jgi:predicted amidohydrolase YtcJ
MNATPDLNSIAPDTPVFVLHLYDRALMNRAAVRAVGYTNNFSVERGQALATLRGCFK